MQLENKDLQILRNLLIKQINPFLIVLFGSAARGCLRADSDIDIAFLSDVSCDSPRLFEISQELAGLLGREIHLIDLNLVSTVLQAQVVGKGKVIWDQDPLRRQEFFILVLKKYAHLNEERAPILNRIKERGSVYA